MSEGSSTQEKVDGVSTQLLSNNNENSIQQEPKESNIISETTIQSGNEITSTSNQNTTDIDNSNNKVRKRKRSVGTHSPRVTLHSVLDPHTGWVANCHSCGKVGKFRHNFEGRPFQHSTGAGKYCGYFKVNPRKITTDQTTTFSNEITQENNNNNSIEILPSTITATTSTSTITPIPITLLPIITTPSSLSSTTTTTITTRGIALSPTSSFSSTIIPIIEE